MNILLVDDDALFIRKTIEGMQWKKIGIDKVFSADDMQQALNIIKDFSIDIMITDIEMPRGNGLELLGVVTKKYKEVDSIVLSGYAHFSYAQKAMEYGAKRFLLKPVSNSELEVTLKEIIEFRKKADDNKSYKRNNFCFKSIENEKKLKDEVANIATSEDNSFYCEICLRILHDSKKNETDLKLLMRMINNVISEFLSQSDFLYSTLFQLDYGKYIILIQKRDEKQSVTEELGKIQTYIKETLQLLSCFYVDKIAKGYEIVNNHNAFIEKCRRLVFCEQSIISIENYSLDNQIEEIDYENLKAELKAGNLEDAKNYLILHIDNLVDGYKIDFESFKYLYEKVKCLAEYFVERQGVDFDEMFEENEMDSKMKLALRSVSGMKGYITFMFARLEGVRNLTNGKKQLVQQIKDYISEHLSEDLTRSKLAKIVNFSEDYVARFFRAETGMTISGYVMEKRMEKAMYYLDETQMSIGDISFEVGFNNFSYFSKTFKMYTGKTPNEYRIRKKED